MMVSPLRNAASAALFGVITGLGIGIAVADEREVTEDQQAAISGAVDETEKPTRPATLPDFTKGAPVPGGTQVWILGPTGIAGVWAGGFGGDQFLVQKTLPGSPAEGQLMPGDVLLGVSGTAFKPGGHLGVLFGNAIIEAEKEENGGKLPLSVWRDRNYSKRNATLNTDRVNLEDVFKAAEDSDALYDWKAAEEKKADTARQKFDEFPIDGFTLDVELKLRTFPAYADTAPFDCPKTMAILEDAWKVLEKKFIVDPKNPGSGRGGTTEALALLASGKPEHRKLLHAWVRGPHCKQWQPEFAGSIDMMKPRGYLSWHVGFVGLPCAIYYDTTGDEYVLPALKEWAVKTAMGQSAGGTWGHTFAWPTFNGGELHRSNPGYGALNAAGVHCFFLMALAKKLGIEHPELDAALERSHRFFGSFVDQGAIPYGDHAAADTDDSNGKNAGAAFAMKLLGDDYAAKYFASMSAHASFTARGGHGHDWHTNWSCWAASLMGPEVRALAERNMRWRRTLCRMHDGSFVYHSPTGSKYGTLRDPTATEVLHQAVALRQTLITGKDPDKSLWFNDKELKQLVAIAQGQFNDPWLDAKVGTRATDRSTDELFELLDVFKPKARRWLAQELGNRFQAGEKAIAGRFLKLLESDNPRLRDAGLRGLYFCGSETVLANLSTITKRLSDEKDFVRITAVGVVSRTATKTEEQAALLAAAAAPPQAVAPNSVRNAIQVPLFAGDTPLAKSPFKAGFDEALVRDALEGLLTLDPVGGKGFLSSRINVWDKDTVVRLANALVFIAEEEQVNDKMFCNRAQPAREILRRHGYLEGYESVLHLLERQAALPRHVRPYVTMLHPKYPVVDPLMVKQQPGAFRGFLPAFHSAIIDNPVATVGEIQGKTKVEVPLTTLVSLIEAAPSASRKPSVGDDARRVFMGKLEAAGSADDKLALCRTTLADTVHRTTFDSLAAIDFLVDTLGAKAVDELLPLFGRDDRRVRDHAIAKATEVARMDGGKSLASRLADAEDEAIQIGILRALGACQSKAGMAVATAALGHADPAVCGAAAEAVAAIGGEQALDPLLAHFKTASAPDDLRGCERALLALRELPGVTPRIRDALIAEVPTAQGTRKESVLWLLGQIGDAPSLAAIEKAGATKIAADFQTIVSALSYSPAIEADAVLLRLAKADKAKAPLVAAQSVRRMVLGPKGYGDRTDDQRIAFASGILPLAGDIRLVTFLGRTGSPRAMPLLVNELRKGFKPAAESVVSNAEAMKKLSPADATIVAQALRDVMEYLEVTVLRGGPEGKDFREYPGAKALQARAGQALVKIHKPETAPIQGFQGLDVGL
jgi:HEAT repeat protein